MEKEEKEEGGKCDQCGKSVRSRSPLAEDEVYCDCKKLDPSSIRLGPVPDSAFRPPSPRPGSKEEHGSIVAATGSTKYEIVSIREKHGEFRKAIPCMPMPAAIICCLLNVLVPGTGTLVAGLTVLCGCRTEQPEKGRAFGYNVVAAVLQLLTAPVIVGWVWSVLWGITFINVSAAKALQDPNAPAAV